VIAPSVAAAERGLARDSCIRVCAWGAHARHIGIVVENESLQHAGCTDLQLAQAADVRKHSDAVPPKAVQTLFVPYSIVSATPSRFYTNL